MPSPPSIDLQHYLKRKREGMVSVFESADCCVLLLFHRSHRFLFSSTDLLLAICIGNVANHRCGSRDHCGHGPPAQASFDEGRSGRSAGTNTSLAVKPFLFSPQAAAGKLPLQFHFGQLSSVVWGRFGTRRQGVLLTVGEPRLLRRGSGGPSSVLGLPSSRDNHPVGLLHVVFHFQTLVVRGSK